MPQKRARENVNKIVMKSREEKIASAYEQNHMRMLCYHK